MCALYFVIILNMKSTIRYIGNSKGVILPQNLLKKCFIEYEVNIEVKDNTIVISPSDSQNLKGWAEAFQEMAKNGDDELIIPDIFEDEDLNDWNWEHFANTSFTTVKSQNI